MRIVTTKGAAYDGCKDIQIIDGVLHFSSFEDDLIGSPRVFTEVSVTKGNIRFYSGDDWRDDDQRSRRTGSGS